MRKELVNMTEAGTGDEKEEMVAYFTWARVKTDTKQIPRYAYDEWLRPKSC